MDEEKGIRRDEREKESKNFYAGKERSRTLAGLSIWQPIHVPRQCI